MPSSSPRAFVPAALFVLALGCRESAPPAAPTPTPIPVTLASLSVAPVEVEGGDAVEGTATLSAAAPAGGTPVSLASDALAATVPATITVPSGSMSAAFSITTSEVSERTSVTILASSGGANRSATLAIGTSATPSGPERPLLALESRHDDLVGGRNSDGTIALAAPARSGGVTVRLTSDDDALDVPRTITIAAGATSATFEIRTAPVATVRTVTIVASLEARALRRAAATLTLRIRLLPVGNQAPEALADNYTTVENTALDVAAPGVLDNDEDADGDALSATVVDDVDDGTLTLNANGSFTYAPDADFSGTDSFSYRASDGKTDSNNATVMLTISADQAAPVAGDNSYAVDEDTTLTVAAPGVLDGDTDADGDALTASLVSDVTKGALTLDVDGSFIYTPGTNFNGSDSFTYRANDGTTDSGIATVAITVDPVEDVETFTYNGTNGADGASQAFVVPAGVTSITIDASGA